VFQNRKEVLGSKELKYGIKPLCSIISGTCSLRLDPYGLLGLMQIGLMVDVCGKSLSRTLVHGVGKKILKLRDIAKRYISFKVGNGIRVFLWFDHWHPAGYLLKKFGHRIVHDSSFHLRSKLEVAIKNGEWSWPTTRSDALVEIQSKLFEVELGDTDSAVWNAKHGQYTCADAWDKLREVCSTVGWWKLVWFPSSIPKHSFFL
jgi:hypothetical protein